jgi:predicted dithiol-disulfide oxidoreductase (DUF899 family)
MSNATNLRAIVSPAEWRAAHERLLAQEKAPTRARDFTSRRGVEALASVRTFLDLTPRGRQQRWEGAPQGLPQSAPYLWWRRHDDYEGDAHPSRASPTRRPNL